MGDAVKLLKDQLNEDDDKVGRTFVIGGGEIYRAALNYTLTRRILLTRILDHFEYDTIFPVGLRANGEGETWRRASNEKLNAWVGEDVGGEVFEEAGTKYQFEMWEYVAQDQIKE
jgi:dihydrofolate reductase